jgi:D-ribose pyranase
VRKDGLWHPRLAALITGLGHTDTLVIADPGLPIPRGVETIDLVWARQQPRFLPVLQAVLGDLIVEAAAVASELLDPELIAGIEERLAGVPLTRIPHDQLKESVRAARAVVRTGEVTPYANVVLTAGVAF